MSALARRSADPPRTSQTPSLLGFSAALAPKVYPELRARYTKKGPHGNKNGFELAVRAAAVAAGASRYSRDAIWTSATTAQGRQESGEEVRLEAQMEPWRLDLNPRGGEGWEAKPQIFEFLASWPETASKAGFY